MTFGASLKVSGLHVAYRLAPGRRRAGQGAFFWSGSEERPVCGESCIQGPSLIYTSTENTDHILYTPCFGLKATVLGTADARP